MTWEEEFITYVAAKEPKSNWAKPYVDKVPSGVTLASLVNTAMRLGKEKDFISKVWEGIEENDPWPPYDYEDYYLARTKDGYEVFDYERGGKHGRTFFKTLPDALAWYFDLVLNVLHYTPSDTVVFTPER